jgi:hypothetical protein
MGLNRLWFGRLAQDVSADPERDVRDHEKVSEFGHLQDRTLSSPKALLA